MQSDEECRRLAASLRQSMEANYSASESVLLHHGKDDAGAYKRSLQYRHGRQSADTSRDLSQLFGTYEVSQREREGEREGETQDARRKTFY